MMLASGAGLDAYIGVWDLWWVRTALASGHNPLETGWLFHPNGTSLGLHTLAFTYSLLSLPIQILLAGLSNPGRLFVTYNLILIASFTLTGYFTYRLALQQTSHRSASLLAGILFAFTNFRFANTVRLHVISTELLVLAVWAWAALLNRPSPGRLMLWAGSMILLVYGSLEYAAYSILLSALLAIPPIASGVRKRRSGAAPEQRAPGHDGSARNPSRHDASGADGTARRQSGRIASGPGVSGPGIPVSASEGERSSEQGSPLRVAIRRHSAGRRAWIWASIVSLVAGTALLNPLLVQISRRMAEGDTTFDPRLAAFFSADLLDFFLPNPRHPFWGGLFSGITGSFHENNAGFGLSLGWIAIALFAVGAVAILRGRRQRIWFWCTICFWVLSLGPVLHAGGRILDLPMPQALLARALPFLAGSRTPIRYVAPMGLCLAVTAAAGWAEIRRRRGFTESGAVSRLEVVIGALLLFEMLSAPFPLTATPIPPAYASIHASPGATAILDVPGTPAREAMLYQTVHQQRLVQDVSSAVPLRSVRGEDPFSTREWALLTRGLGASGLFSTLTAEQQARFSSNLVAFLRRNSIRWIVLEPSRWSLAADGKSFSSEPSVSGDIAAAFRENLRALHPASERQVGDATVFEFEVPPIGK